MAYTLRPLKRQKMRYDSPNADNKIIYQHIVDGEKVTPTSATIAIYAPGEATATLAATAMTLSGTLLTYVLSTETEADYPVGESYRAEITVTYNAVVYPKIIVMFDVVKFLLNMQLVADSIRDRDEGVMGGEHAGDEAFPGLLAAVRDELQLMIETRAFAEDQMLENMILDHARFAIVARLYFLECYWREKRDAEMADYYERKFRDTWRAFLDGIKFDKNVDGTEDERQGQLIKQRLML